MRVFSFKAYNTVENIQQVVDDGSEKYARAAGAIILDKEFYILDYFKHRKLYLVDGVLREPNPENILHFEDWQNLDTQIIDKINTKKLYKN